MKEIFEDYPQFLLSNDVERWESEVSDKIAHLEDLKEIVVHAKQNFSQRFGLKQHMTALTEIYENAN